MFNNLLDIDFYKERGHAVVACLSVLYLTIGYVAGLKVDISMFADLTIAAGALVIFPHLKIAGVDSSNNLARNIFGYFFLGVIVFIALGDSHKFLHLPEESKAEFFSIVSHIMLVLFGASKFELSRDAIEGIKNTFNWKRRLGTLVDAYTEDVETDVSGEQGYDAEEVLEAEVSQIRTGNTKGNLLTAMQSYRGMCEIKGSKHNKKLLALAKKAGFDWYTQDEIPWCAVMMNICCMIAEIPGTKSAMAKSFLKWGKPVNLETARKNIGTVIAIFHRGESENDPSGHVTVVESISEDGTYIHGIGGNQSDCVRTSKMMINTWRFIEFRMI